MQSYNIFISAWAAVLLISVTLPFILGAVEIVKDTKWRKAQ